MSCSGCDGNERIRRGNHEAFVAELDETFMVLSGDQRYPGWSVFFLKDHYEHMAMLPLDRQQRIFGDVALGAAAVWKAFSPVRLNYECLGNVLGHIHWHVIPRHGDDPDPGATIWVRPEDEAPVVLDDRAREAYIQGLRGALDAVRSGSENS
jgi:diadenosine tetraphosphate (Ap4A) HIT family hydrolase